MKKVEAFIRREALEPIRSDLEGIGIGSISVCEYMGSSRAGGVVETYRGAAVPSSLRPQLKLEIVVPDDSIEKVLDTVVRHAYTGRAGDGKVFVLPVEEAIRIRLTQGKREGRRGVWED